MPIKSVKRFDVVILVILILVFALSLALYAGGDSADIYVDGALYKSVSLDNDCVIDLGTNVLEVKNHSIRMISSNCPNHICERASGNIICVPNRVSVVLRRNGNIDAVVK